MFGYIQANSAELKMKEYCRYRGFYCGLCRRLLKKYGLTAQMLLSYDMTFLILLLTGLYEQDTDTRKILCPLHPSRRQMALTNRFTDYAADMTVALAYFDLRDDWDDDRNPAGLAGAKLLKKHYDRIKERYPRQCGAIEEYVEQLQRCELSDCDDLDRVAGLTGRMLGEIFLYKKDRWSTYLWQTGFFLGKFIYLMDAWEDLDKDTKRGRYNPLWSHRNDEEYEQWIDGILTMMMAECCRAFEMLPIVQDADMMRNILYAGVWVRRDLVREKARAKEEKKRGKDKGEQHGSL